VGLKLVEPSEGWDKLWANHASDEERSGSEE